MGVASAATALRDWAEAPFVGDVSPVKLFWLFGLIAVIALAWQLILIHIRNAASAI